MVSTCTIHIREIIWFFFVLRVKSVLFCQKWTSVITADITVVLRLHVLILMETITVLVHPVMKEMDSTVLVRKLTLFCKSLAPELFDPILPSLVARVDRACNSGV